MTAGNTAKDSYHCPEVPSHLSLPILFNNVLGLKPLWIWYLGFPGWSATKKKERMYWLPGHCSNVPLRLYFWLIGEEAPDLTQLSAFSHPRSLLQHQEVLCSFLQRSTTSENRHSQFLTPRVDELRGAETHNGCQQEAKQGSAGSTWSYFQVLQPMPDALSHLKGPSTSWGNYCPDWEKTESWNSLALTVQPIRNEQNLGTASVPLW